MFRITQRGRHAAAALAVIATAALTIGLAAPADAAGTTIPDANATATLVIHKHATPRSAEGNGLPQDVTSDPIAQVPFAITKVPGVDLSTNAGWVAASAMTEAQAIAATSGVTPATTVTTDVAGVASATLPIGLYLVTEQERVNPADGKTLVPLDPFLVTLPMTDPVHLNEWLYTVHVYPKNDDIALTKTVDDSQAVKLGDVVTWDVRADVPADALTSYSVTDHLDSRLGFVADTSTVALVTDAGETAMAAGDYTLTESSGVVTLAMTPSGLATLTAAKQAAGTGAVQVHLALTTTVLACDTTDANAVDGVITNIATQLVNGTETTSNTAETDWGSAKFLKKADKDNPDTALNERDHLAGAVFEVYDVNPATNPGAKPLTILGATTGPDGASQWVSDANGAFEVDGLKVRKASYWLVEVTAPAGYELLAAPVEFTVSGEAGDDVPAGNIITNVEKNAGFQLPLTGGSGTAMLTLGGGLVLAAAVVLVVRSRRRSA